MSNPSSLPARLQSALLAPNRGVLGLVDELLAISRDHSLHVAWEGGRCRVQFVEGGLAGQIEVPLQKTVLRAALARVAVLCNERLPNSVSLYGGQGELLLDADPTKTIRVLFINTPDEQILELSSVQLGAPPPNGEENKEEKDKTSGTLSV